MTYWELSDPWTIINRVYDPHTTKGDIARLSRIVVDEAAKGDEVSQRIIEHTASDLARFARAAANRLQLDPDLSLALVGGMLIHVEPFRDLVVDDLRQDWRIDHVELVEDPALTAARSLASAWKGVTA
jgi:N-acetylglucosamine kinase-like BadF-type ATPase